MKAPGDAAVQALLDKEAIHEVVYRRARATDARDLALINEHADRLNAEAGDVLGYQVEW